MGENPFKKILKIINITATILIFGGLTFALIFEGKLLKLPDTDLYNLPKTLFASPTPSSTPSPLRDTVYKVQFTGKLENDIPAVFSDAKYGSIVSIINSAQQTSNLAVRYQNYKNAYQMISTAYQDTKNPDFLLALLEVRSFARSLDQFQASDVPMPQ